MANGKSYRVRYPNGKEANVSEAVVEAYKAKKKNHGQDFDVLHEVDRLTGEPIKKFKGGSAGDRATE